MASVVKSEVGHRSCPARTRPRPQRRSARCHLHRRTPRTSRAARSTLHRVRHVGPHVHRRVEAAERYRGTTGRHPVFECRAGTSVGKTEAPYWYTPFTLARAVIGTLGEAVGLFEVVLIGIVGVGVSPRRVGLPRAIATGALKVRLRNHALCWLKVPSVASRVPSAFQSDP